MPDSNNDVSKVPVVDIKANLHRYQVPLKPPFSPKLVPRRTAKRIPRIPRQTDKPSKPVQAPNKPASENHRPRTRKTQLIHPAGLPSSNYIPTSNPNRTVVLTYQMKNIQL
ncbi:hypothetical protein PGT21_027591 [Puccinia graminis f. sp. tritici]|uniref:Uncharacterized protein n=1 Tax=Puccinia graminis f. sp. tritici TaxID=56615 RepID=A0A5B0MG48_PUCGR|nr:hypothetical protein PGT21_027591 [Puccinia graminis f. sp. tritici]